MAGHTLLYGEKVRLTALEKSDVSLMTAFNQDTDFLRSMSMRPAMPPTEEAIRQQLEGWEKDSNNLSFAIRTRKDNRLLGSVGLFNILWTNGVAWLGIGIGDPIHRGKGYGGEAMQLILDFAFRELNLYRVQLIVFAYNTGAIQLYEQLGFQHEATYREAIRRDGQHHDIYLYGMLRHEWESKS